LALSLGEAALENIIRDSIKMMAKFIGIREPNIRYTALEILSKATPQHLVTYPTLLKDNLNELLKGLKEPDISIRKAALDNLFILATEETSAEIINELLDHISDANDFTIVEEMVLKVAILAERFAINLSWYVDVIIKLIEYAGDYTSEDLWFRVAQMVTGFAADEEE